MNMSLLGKSIQDFEQKKGECLDFLAELKGCVIGFNSDLPSGELSGRDRMSEAKVKSIEERIAGAKLKILVAGQFNTGKSTLLNAILGASVLPEDVAPCTAVITEIEYGEKAAASLFFKDGLNAENLPPTLNKEILAHIHKHLPGAVPPFVLHKIDNDILVDYLTIPLGMEQDEGVRESPYSRCKLNWPLKLCRDGAILIDSPGLNEHESRDATTMSYLEEADMILHVLSSSQPCGMPDKKFIEEVRLRGNSSFPIIFAFNRFDQLRNDKDRERIKNYAWSLKELEGPYRKEGIFFTSALKALEGRLDGDEEKVRASGVADLEELIAKIFVEDRFKIKLSHILAVKEDLEEFDKSLASLENLLIQDSSRVEKAWQENLKEFDRLEEEILRIRKKIDRVANRYEKEFRYALTVFFNRFCDNILPQIVKDANLPEISVLNHREASKEAVKKLNVMLNMALGDHFTRWLYSEASELEKQILKELQEDIEENLQEFAASLGKVRNSIQPDAMTGAKEAQVEIMDFMPDALAGAGLGGAVGYAAVFIASRFVPLVAGPAGWAVVAVTTVLMALLAASGSDSREKVKREYVSRTQQSLREQSASNIPEMAHAAALKFRESLLNLHMRLEEKINDVRKPLEITRKALGARQEDLETKMKSLHEYKDRFARLQAIAKNLCAKI